MNRINENEYTLNSEDSSRFKGDQPYYYCSAGDPLTKLGMPIYYPNER